MNPIVVIGSGLAGYTVARELRRLNNNTPLLIITADDGGFYSKPMLSNAFAQGKQAQQLVTQTAVQMVARLGASILTKTHVCNIDTRSKSIITDAGNFDYDRLVLAVGAQPIRLALDDDAAEEVISVNHVGDYALFRQRSTEGCPHRNTRRRADRLRVRGRFASDRWHVTQDGERTVCCFHDEAGVVPGFGVVPQDTGIWQSLLAELGTVFDAAA